MSRKHIHVSMNIGDKVADGVTNFFGTWLCLGLHTLWFMLWFVLRLDVSLLTNIVSLEAIGLAILIMMSQSRSGVRDRLRDDLESVEVEEIRGLTLSIRDIVLSVQKINQQQNEVLAEWHELKPTIEHIQALMESEVLKQSDQLEEVLTLLKAPIAQKGRAKA